MARHTRNCWLIACLLHVPATCKLYLRHAPATCKLYISHVQATYKLYLMHVPATCKLYLRGTSAEAIVCAVKLRQKSSIKLAISSSHSTLTSGQPVLDQPYDASLLTGYLREYQVSGDWNDSTRAGRDSIPVITVLQADALQPGHPGGRKQKEQENREVFFVVCLSVCLFVCCCCFVLFVCCCCFFFA